MTRSPQIDEVLQYARDRADGRTAPELRPALEQADQMLTQMSMIFEAQLRFRERTEAFGEQLPRVNDAFERLSQAMVALRDGHFRMGADALEQAFNDLMDAMDALRAEEESWPTYSRSPYMNILMRLAHGAARGGIEPDALDQGLSEMLMQHERMIAGLDGAVRPGREAAQFEARRDEIHGYLELIVTTLQQARQALAEGRVETVPDLLEPARAATDALADVQQAFQQAEQSVRQRPCFRCGTSNERSNRHCTKCGGMLPPMPMEMEEDHAPSVDVTLEEGQMKARGHAQTELTHKLQQAAVQVRQGQMTHDDFTAVLDEAAARLARARADFEKLQMPPDATPEAVEVGRQAAERMRTAFDEFDEGLQRMRRWLVDNDPTTLDFGLEGALSGGDKLASFQAIVQGPPS